MAVINKSMRKVIKGMAVTAQTAQFVSLMPKPEDFVTRIVGDVVYLSVKVQKLSLDINKLLDDYSHIPGNYLMTQMNSMTDSANRIVDRVNIFTQNGINQVLDVPINTLDIISATTGGVIDAVGETSKAVTSFGMTVAHTSSAILGQEDVATDIHEATTEILEWTGNGFKSVKTNATSPINKASQSIANAKYHLDKSVNGVATSIQNTISKPQKYLEQLITNLRKQIEKLSKVVDGGFKDVTGINSIASGANYVNEALRESDNRSPSAQATLAVSKSLNEVLKNFSIAKVITAFGGVLVESLIVKAGLDQLPPIDFESMMKNLTDENKKTNEDLYKELNEITDNAYNDVINFGVGMNKLPIDERNYTDKKYKEFIKQFDDDIKKQREEIRLDMKSRDVKPMSPAEEMKERRKLKSAIKEVRKFRKQVKNAKKSDKLHEVINNELKGLRKETEYRCNSIKSDWNQMMKQYKDAIAEITKFFKGGGDGDKFINDCCDRINDDCDEIKELCSGLTRQLIACGLKVASPTTIGPGFPNPVYKLGDFWMDIKTIFKFIKELIKLVIDILNHVNKLARIILNGINNLNEIIRQLTKIIGLQWFIDLIQSIVDMFGGKITDARVLLENMLTAVYYSDTEEYENTIEIFEKLEEGGTLSKEDIGFLSDKDRFFVIDAKKLKDDDDIEKMLEELDKKEDEIVAYKSMIIAPSENDQDNNSVPVSKIMDGTLNLDSDVNIIGWHFFHPNLNHNKKYSWGGIFGKLIKKIKAKIIKKAAKTGNKKRGGIKMLKRKKIKKDRAYDAFYWYTVYTDDLEKDCFEWSTPQDAIKIDSVIQTENGSIVELSDGRKVFVANNMVKSGDYVNVEGVKYRVK